MLRMTNIMGFAHTKICIVGGGTGGLNVSSHLLRAKIPGNDIRIFEGNSRHYYQPGWTMLGANLCKPSLTYRNMHDVLPKNVHVTGQYVKAINPEKN